MTATSRMTAVLLVALVLAGPAGLLAHHHHGLQEDDHCAACVLAAGSLAALPLLLDVPALMLLVSRFVPPIPALVSSRPLHPTSGRAPPA